MSLFQWPFKRLQYPGIGNPRFVGDIVAANEAVIDACTAITGLNGTDFAIITGLDYTTGSPLGTYAPGIFYLNGSFYYCSGTSAEGLYLIGSSIPTMQQPFDDGNSRNIYSIQQGNTTNVSTDASPILSGNMNQYRIGLKYLQSVLISLSDSFASLGDAAFLDIGTTSGTVAAGNDPRFGYTIAQINNLFALKTTVLQFGNTGSFTPTVNNDPATKLYVDTSLGFKLLWVGTISSDGSIILKQGPTASSIVVTCTHLATGHYQINHNIGNTNYFATGFGINNTSPDQFVSLRSTAAIDNTSFEYYTSDDSSANDADIQLQIYAWI